MKNPTLLVAAAIILVIVFTPVAQSVKITLILLLLIITLYLKRGYIFVALGSRALNGRNPNEAKAWRYYTMGWKAGLPPSYTIMLGNLFVQRGDPTVALEIFDSVIAKQQRRQKDGEIIASAKISRSMALWVLGKRDEAIDSLQELRAQGRMDKNLIVNLVSYLLDENRLAEAKDVIEEAAEHLDETPGMVDNRGHYMFLTGSLLEARKIYDTLISDGTPRFPEAYVHAAQVKIALKNHKTAALLLEKALECPFYKTSTVTKEEVTQLLEEQYGLFDSDVGGDDLIEDVLERTLYDNDMFDEESPNTDLTEDDDVEPNIELAPEDYIDEDESEIEIDSEDISELESELFDDDYDEEEDDKK